MTVAVALSTMWAQQPRFDANMAAFAELAREAGYTHVEVSHATDEPGLRTLMRQETLPLSSLHAPTPRERIANGRWNTDLNLAAADETERAAAVTATLRTLDLAAEAGAGSVVVHLGAVGSAGVGADSALRRLYAAGQSSGAEVERERQRAREQRAARAPAALEAAKRSLAELAARARQLGVRIGLENRMWYHELPLPAEAAALLSDYEPDVAGYWHDVGHAEILARLGLVPLVDWFDANGDRLVGCHLHDMEGIVDHRAPGSGDVDWSFLAKRFGEIPVRTLEINQHQPEPSLAAALTLLRGAGVLPATV
jgi:sugar phosphate isomerase/epimerase